MKTERKETTEEVRKIIINLKNQGKTISEISNIVNRSRSTVQTIITKFRNRGNVKNKIGRGRKKCLNETQIRHIIRKIKQNPHLSAVEIAKDTIGNENKPVCPSTIRNVLNSHGFHGRTPRIKPIISKINRKKRLEYAKKYKNKTFEFWENVLFTDESKFLVCHPTKQKKVWRQCKKELDPKNTDSSVKHGGGSVMVWGCMAASGSGNLTFIDETMKAHDYLKILKENVKPSAEKLGLRGPWCFLQDNDPKHTSYIARQWIIMNTPKMIEHPPQSPDLNPIEHLWENLKRNIKKHEIFNKNQLKAALLEEWSRIDVNFTRKLVESMPRRLEAVIKSGGGPTKY